MWRIEPLTAFSFSSLFMITRLPPSFVHFLAPSTHSISSELTHSHIGPVVRLRPTERRSQPEKAKINKGACMEMLYQRANRQRLFIDHIFPDHRYFSILFLSTVSWQVCQANQTDLFWNEIRHFRPFSVAK